MPVSVMSPPKLVDQLGGAGQDAVAAAVACLRSGVARVALTGSGELRPATSGLVLLKRMADAESTASAIRECLE
ncbi:hypothetical protein ACPZ19_16125 [Amycolatopsis lurida]